METHVLLIFGTLVTAALAQTPADNSAEKIAIAASDRAFEAAYTEAIGEFFTDDAQYSSAEGQTFSGRNAKEEQFSGNAERKPARGARNLPDQAKIREAVRSRFVILPPKEVTLKLFTS